MPQKEVADLFLRNVWDKKAPVLYTGETEAEAISYLLILT